MFANKLGDLFPMPLTANHPLWRTRKEHPSETQETKGQAGEEKRMSKGCSRFCEHRTLFLGLRLRSLARPPGALRLGSIDSRLLPRCDTSSLCGPRITRSSTRGTAARQEAVMSSANSPEMRPSHSGKLICPKLIWGPKNSDSLRNGTLNPQISVYMDPYMH